MSDGQQPQQWQPGAPVPHGAATPPPPPHHHAPLSPPPQSIPAAPYPVVPPPVAGPPAGYPPYAQPGYGPAYPPAQPPFTGGVPAVVIGPDGRPVVVQQIPRKDPWVAAPIPEPGVSYAQALLPLRRRWGRFFLSLGVAVAFFAIGQMLSLILLLPQMSEIFTDPNLAYVSQQELTDRFIGLMSGPLGFLSVNVGWAVMVVGVPVALTVYGDKAAGLAHSVVGRFRWKLAGLSAVGIAPVFAVYIWSTLVREPGIDWSFRPEWLMVAIVLLTTPLQSAGEEYTFRGWLTQHIGSWFRNRHVAWIVPAVLTGLAFGLAHLNPLLSAFMLLTGVGITCSILTQITGGLEAAIVLHSCNNVFIFLPLALTGNFASAFGTAGGGAPADDWIGFGAAILAMALSVLWVWLVARKFTKTGNQTPGDLVRQPALA